MHKNLVTAVILVIATSCADDAPPLVERDAGTTIPPDAGETNGVDAGESDAGANIPARPNILLIIADDLGLDASAQYALSTDLPTTPTLDTLAANGIVFDNAWATPACTTTRGTIISGQHGVHSGVTFVPATLPNDTMTLQQMLAADDATQDYANAIFGKWHLGGGNPPLNHPDRFGVGHYAGNLAGTIDDYVQWPLTQDGQTTESTTYHTTEVTDLAIDWIATQNTPWFVWLAYVAPHAPFHLPPAELHDRTLSGTPADIDANTRSYYLASIEAMDHEIGRLLESLPAETRDNTIVIFVGDNGTPRAVIDRSVFAGMHGKNSLYEGGVRVPLIVSGADVRRGAREDALINTTDLMATILSLAGNETPHVFDSTSFAHRLRGASGTDRTHNYVEFESAAVTGWATRNQRYKLIEFADGTRELYDLPVDIGEENDLLATTGDFAAIVTELSDYATSIRGVVPEAQDITNMSFVSRASNCAEHVARYSSSVRDVARDVAFMGSTTITVMGDTCAFDTNGIPNHDFNDGMRPFPNDVRAVNARFEVPTQPAMATASTPLSLRVDNAILLNGVKVDLLAAGCFGVGNGRTGCNDINTPWRYDPMHASSGFNVDSFNAHAQPNGQYHYHGPPYVLFEDSNTSPSPVVGFAADGFPIFGPYFFDGTNVRRAATSYRVRAGSRPSGPNDPGGVYSGTFRDDYEYVDGLGDLDECNGMTVDGVYGYYVTNEFPYLMACFRGTTDPSFDK